MQLSQSTPQRDCCGTETHCDCEKHTKRDLCTSWTCVREIIRRGWETVYKWYGFGVGGFCRTFFHLEECCGGQSAQLESKSDIAPNGSCSVRFSFWNTFTGHRQLFFFFAVSFLSKYWLHSITAIEKWHHIEWFPIDLVLTLWLGLHLAEFDGLLPQGLETVRNKHSFY